MERKWTKILAVICMLALFLVLVALTVAKWVDHMDPDAPPPAEGPWSLAWTNLLVAGASACAAFACVAIRSRAKRSQDNEDSGDQPWEA